MNKIEIYFHRLKADNGWVFLLIPTIGLSRFNKLMDLMDINFRLNYA